MEAEGARASEARGPPSAPFLCLLWGRLRPRITGPPIVETVSARFRQVKCLGWIELLASVGMGPMLSPLCETAAPYRVRTLPYQRSQPANSFCSVVCALRNAMTSAGR